jgi:phospholipase C
MKRLALYLWTAAAATCLALGACSGGSSPLPGEMLFAHHRGSGNSPISHVVIIVQENRSFDNLFALFPGANGATRGKAREKVKGKYVDKWIKLKAHTLTLGTDLQHCHAAFENDYDGGAMDGFYSEGKGACTASTPKPSKALTYQYVQKSDIEPYWDIAEQWVLADAMFQTQGSGSFTAHQDLIRGGTCVQSCPSPSASTESLVDNPTYWPWGCDANLKNVKTAEINIYGMVKPQGGPPPCSNLFPNYGSGGYDTLRDLLDAAKVSWKYYTPCFSASKQPGCNPSSDCDGGKSSCDADLLNAFDVIYPVWSGSEWGTNVSWPETNILSDISSKQLPAVSWVIPSDANSDHPDEKTDTGPEWVASVVNAIGESSYWNSSAIIVIWDDWGGFYDNAAPPFQDQFGGLGFRVPMMVLSPYAIAGTGSKGGYVAHTQYEFASILKFIEGNWSLGSLGTTDTRATSIGNVFNYSQSPRGFTAIPSSKDAQYFIEQPHTIQHGDPE